MPDSGRGQEKGELNQSAGATRGWPFDNVGPHRMRGNDGPAMQAPRLVGRVLCNSKDAAQQNEISAQTTLAVRNKRAPTWRRRVVTISSRQGL